MVVVQAEAGCGMAAHRRQLVADTATAGAAGTDLDPLPMPTGRLCGLLHVLSDLL